MKTLPTGLAASLATGQTTLCRCWRLDRQDGETRGFTDHDNDLAFDGVAFRADTGMTASAWAASLGLAVDTIDATGALSDDSLTEADLARGLWDGAVIRVYIVDWSNVANRVLDFSGSIGEVQRGPVAFKAELRSLAYALNQPQGRIYSNNCDANVGDSRCGINLNQPVYRGTGLVTDAIDLRRVVRVSGLASYTAGWFARGLFSFSSGANSGLSMEVKRHSVDASGVLIELVEDVPFDILAGVGFVVTAGCDKTIGTCKAKFDNVVNFRGFPHMPGNDWVSSYPNSDDGNDGSALGS
jgi:uncharacterized phage protein (TIGR02218 family)